MVHHPVFSPSSIAAPFPKCCIQYSNNHSIWSLSNCCLNPRAAPELGLAMRLQLLASKMPFFLQKVSLKLQGMISNGVMLLLMSLFYYYSGEVKQWCLPWLLDNAASDSSSENIPKLYGKKKTEEIPSCLSCSFFLVGMHKEDKFGEVTLQSVNPRFSSPFAVATK